jgi:hypothetical protein
VFFIVSFDIQKGIFFVVDVILFATGFELRALFLARQVP